MSVRSTREEEEWEEARVAAAQGRAEGTGKQAREAGGPRPQALRASAAQTIDFHHALP